MARIPVYELGTIVTDNVTGTKGMLTHLNIEMDHSVDYIFQPKGLNPRTGLPVDRIWLTNGRIKGGIPVNLDAPLEILGTQGEDEGTGFAGTIVSLIYHINGCFHVELKPKGILKETGSTIAPQEFDIRRVKGPAIKRFTKKELEESVKDKPSPISTVGVTK